MRVSKNEIKEELKQVAANEGSSLVAHRHSLATSTHTSSVHATSVSNFLKHLKTPLMIRMYNIGNFSLKRPPHTYSIDGI